MQRWEYAQFYWEGPGMGKRRYVEFSHRDPIDKIPGGPDALLGVMRRLGDEG